MSIYSSLNVSCQNYIALHLWISLRSKLTTNLHLVLLISTSLTSLYFILYVFIKLPPHFKTYTRNITHFFLASKALITLPSVPFGKSTTDYRWVSYNKTIRSAGYFAIEKFCYRNSGRQNRVFFYTTFVVMWITSIFCTDLKLFSVNVFFFT